MPAKGRHMPGVTKILGVYNQEDNEETESES